MLKICYSNVKKRGKLQRMQLLIYSVKSILYTVQVLVQHTYAITHHPQVMRVCQSQKCQHTSQNHPRCDQIQCILFANHHRNVPPAGQVQEPMLSALLEIDSFPCKL